MLPPDQARVSKHVQEHYPKANLAKVFTTEQYRLHKETRKVFCLWKLESGDICGEPVGIVRDVGRHVMNQHMGPNTTKWKCPVEGCGVSYAREYSTKRHISNVHLK